ncbi:MAG: MarR family transcriptional regulator [Alphaproteobacteria bacterium]|nr:MarR family transcriptional regulator [Alphaproteobacteria bacterium]
MAGRPLEHYLSYLLAQADRQMHLQLDEHLRADGVQVEEWRILRTLSDGAGRSMGALAQQVLMNHPALTKMIDRMISRALVYRAPDPGDRRKVLVFISDRGRSLHRKLSRKIDRHQATLDSRWGSDRSAELKRLLEAFIQHSGER